MKKTLAVLAAVVTLALPSLSQTNSPVTNSPTSLLPGGLGQIAGDFGKFFTDAQPYFTNNIRVGLGYLYADKSSGVLLHSVYQINDQIGVGFAAAYLKGSFYDASLGLNAGTTWNLPVIGKVYTELESGPGWNLKKQQVIEQSFAVATKSWDIYKGWNLIIAGGAGNISDIPGPAYVGSLMIGKHF